MSHDRERIYFISDVHLGAPSLAGTEPERIRQLVAFLRHIREDAHSLYIVGDLFDFWFEYCSVVPSTGARVLFELYNAVQAGVRVVYIPGNHDIWLGNYLRDEIGIELPGEAVELDTQDKRLYITHGDSFRKDFKFRVSRGILKSPLCIALFRWLHPDIGAWLARSTSRYSVGGARNHASNRRTFEEGAREQIGRNGQDIVLIGHYHLGIIKQIGAGQLVILDDWLKRGSYALLECGQISLHPWTESAP